MKTVGWAEQRSLHSFSADAGSECPVPPDLLIFPHPQSLANEIEKYSDYERDRADVWEEFEIAIALFRPPSVLF